VRQMMIVSFCKRRKERRRETVLVSAPAERLRHGWLELSKTMEGKK